MAVDIGTETGLSDTKIFNALQAGHKNKFRTLGDTVIWGDSVTNHNISDTLPYTYNVGYFVQLNVLMGKPFTLLNDGGVSGETTGEILARFETDVAAYDPKYVFIFAGLNDLMGSVDYETITSNLSAIYDSIESIGATTITATIYGTASISESNASLWMNVNRWIRKEAQARGHLLLDFAKSLTDPSSGTYPYTISGVYQDGLHINHYGAYLIAKDAKEVLSKYFGQNMLMPSNSLDPANSVSNVLNYGTGGTINNGGTGTAPDDMNTYINSLPSGSTLVGSIESGVGYRHYRTTVTGTEQLQAWHRPTCSAPTEGEYYFGIVEFDCDLTDVNFVYLKLRTLGGSDPQTAYDNRTYADTADVPNYVVQDGMLITPIIQCDSGATSMVLDFFFQAASGTIDVKRISVLTADGLDAWQQ